MNKIFGIILYIIGSLFILAFVGQLPKFLAAIINLFKIFSSELDGLQRGNIIGTIIYWIIHFAIIYFAFKYGSRFFKKKPTQV
tara:strand:- start:844 stop:1092 length:249 start_codon:yes stop_codon:yes gene_type:complete